MDLIVEEARQIRRSAQREGLAHQAGDQPPRRTPQARCGSCWVRLSGQTGSPTKAGRFRLIRPVYAVVLKKS